VDARLTEQAPDTAAVGPMGLVAPPEKHRIEISPLNRRRWQAFKANRRGYYALWAFLALFLLSLPAEFIANSKPFLVSYNGSLFFPALVSYPETTFGGDF
jgi:microcin C transport system permease protein